MEFIINTDYKYISPYSISMLLSFFISFSISAVILIKENVNKTLSMCSGILFTMLSLYFGAVYSFLFYREDKSIGFSSIGGLIGFFIGISVFCIIFKEYRERLLKVYTLIIPLLYSISKLGCFFAGCCEGICYDKIFNVIYFGKVAHIVNTKLFPVQLLESIVFLSIFLFIFYLTCVKKIFYKKAIYFNVTLCSFSKFLLDFLRNSHEGEVLSINQIACIIVFFIMIIFLIKDNKNRLKDEI